MTDLVRQLENTSEKTAQVKILQEIGKKLLTEYVIKVGDITIKPLWVEAYYSDTNTGFVDEAVHGNECQKNRYGVLYFHHKTDDQRSGVDICLSCGNYYLSYLLKYTLVNGTFKSHRGDRMHKTHRHRIQHVQRCGPGYCEGYQSAFCDRVWGEEIPAAKNRAIEGIYRCRLFG